MRSKILHQRFYAEILTPPIIVFIWKTVRCFLPTILSPTTINRQFRYSHEYDHFILNATATELQFFLLYIYEKHCTLIEVFVAGDFGQVVCK